MTSWSLGAIEEITCHQCWELSLPFFLAFNSAKPRGARQFDALNELFPGVADADFTLVSHLKCNGGQASPGDVVSFRLADGIMRVGELLISIGVRDKLYSVASIWPHSSVDNGWLACVASDEHRVKFGTESLDTVFTYVRSGGGPSACLYLPFEVREG